MRRGLAILLWAIGALALGLRLTVADGEPWAAPIFYALPLPVLAGLFLLAAALGRGSARVGAGLLALLVAGWWLATSLGWARPEAGTWKFATWNMQGPRHPSRALMDFVRREQPDFLAVIEAGILDAGVAAAYERALPGYRCVGLGGDRVAFVRGGAAGVRVERLDGRSRIAAVRVLLRGRWFHVLVVDLDSNPLRSRRPALDWLAAQAGRNRSTVVLGDFNTPSDSALLAPLRDPCTDVMTERRHSGFRETWGYGVPLLALDQIWLSRDLKTHFARRVPSLASDHAALLATFSAR